MTEIELTGAFSQRTKKGATVCTLYGTSPFSEFEKDTSAGRHAIGKKCEAVFVGTACRDVIEKLQPGMTVAIFYGQPRMYNGQPYAPVEKIEIVSK